MAGPVYLFFLNAVEWLNPIVHAAGLALALWAFRCCRRCGYLVVGFYFALVLFSLFAMPSINRAIRERRASDISEQTQKKIDAAVQQAINRVLEEQGHPVMAAERTIHFPFGPIVLVVGLWLIARRDIKGYRANKALQRTGAPPASSEAV